MKKFIYTLMIAGFGLQVLAQCIDCPDDKEISTNYDDNKNCEVEEEYPTKTNQFLNSFNWAKNTNNIFHSIKLNPDAGWQVPDFSNTNAPLSMQSPFYEGYLARPAQPINDHDFHWEDGWELMWMNTGYFPNGDVYHNPGLNNNPIVDATLGLHHQKIPYIILYNRYTGKMRLLFNVFADLGQFSDVNLDIGYLDIALGENVSGVFRHVNGYDTPLDQKTSSPSFSTNFENFNNNQKWFMSDVQLGYDACACYYFSQFDFKLWGIEEYKIDLYGRSISADLKLRDDQGNPTYTNFLNMNTADADLFSKGGGALIYKSLEGMLNGYDKALKKYNDELKDYNSLGNKAMRTLMGIAKSGLNSGLQGLVPKSILKELATSAALIIAKTTDKKNYRYQETWENQDPNDPTSPWVLKTKQVNKQTGEHASQYSKDLSKVLKSSIGSMSDALFTSFYNADKKPMNKPSMPTASFTEMKITGDIKKVSEIGIGNLYNPGSFKFGGSTFNPSAYPIYNEAVGLFALLKTPALSVYKRQNYNYVDNIDPDGSNDWARWEEYENEMVVKLKSPLKYRFNHAVDIDFKKTEIYAQYQIEMKVNLNFKNTLKGLKVLHSIPEGDFVINTYVSDWYPIEMIGEFVFALSSEGILYVEIGEQPRGDNQLILNNIKLKLMSDMYFKSKGFGGTEKNTTQVFTYLMYDKDKGVDYIQSKGEYVTDKSSLIRYISNTLILENEVIDPSDDFVYEVIGNIIYINALYIELKGNISVASGYHAELQAYWEIYSEPASQISPGISLSIKRDFLQIP